MPVHLRLVVSLLACFLGPALAGTVIGVVVTLAQATGGATAFEGGFHGWMLAVGSYVTLSLMIATPTMLVVGLPLQAAMARRGITRLLWHGLGAAVAGGIAASVLFVWIVSGLGTAVLAFPAGFLYGGLSGFFAWFVRRPDRDHLFDPPRAYAA